MQDVDAYVVRDVDVVRDVNVEQDVDAEQDVHVEQDVDQNVVAVKNQKDQCLACWFY